MVHERRAWIVLAGWLAFCGCFSSLSSSFSAQAFLSCLSMNGGVSVFIVVSFCFLGYTTFARIYLLVRNFTLFSSTSSSSPTVPDYT